MSSKFIDVTSSIFESNDQCEGRLSDIDNCESVDRIIYALKYYTFLNTKNKNNNEGQSTYISFIQTTYPNYLNDTIHLTTTHESNLQTINKSLFTKYSFNKCDLKTCILSDRHCKINRKNTDTDNDDNDDKMDPVFIFYQNTFDSLHHYLFHLFDLGFRSISKQLQNSDHDEKEMKVDAFSDHEMLQNIENKRTCLSHVYQRFTPENNRFLIQTDAKQEEPNHENTFLDSLYEEIGTCTNEVLSLHLFLLSEEYDSVALKQDIEHINYNINTSNILSHMAQITNPNMIKKISSYIKYHHLRSMVFSTGFTFWYWSFYKNTNIEPIFDNYNNVNDFHGYSVSDLYIDAGKWNNFKDEILDIISMEMYSDIILVKSKQYMNTDRMKDIEAKETFFAANRHYENEVGSQILESHIIALIIYCDFTDVSTSFSSTFRRLKPLETLQSVKQRNQKYYWLSRNLREAVEVYGDCYPDICGPFYTGMSCVMVMPEFYLRLNGPTSTSKQKEIAINFSKNMGIVIQINNQYYGQKQRFFDVSWLSKYKGEDERFTFSGAFRLEIQSILNTRTKQNFKLFFKPLCYFDAVLSGMRLDEYELNNKEISVLSTLINRENVQYDTYIIDTFEMFCLQKQTVTINMHWINNYCANEIKNMLFHSMKPVSTDDYQSENDVNIISSRILNMFPNLQNIIIYSTEPIENKSYPFSLSLFLQLLKSLESTINGNKLRCVINGVWKDKFNKNGKRSWLFNEYSSFSANKNTFALSLTSYRNKSGFFQCYNDALIISSLK